MEDKPVVALTQNLGRDAAGLLGDQHRAQIVLAAFLDPGDVWFGGGIAIVQNRLSLLDHRDGRNRSLTSRGKRFLIAVEDVLENQPGQYQRLAAPHQREIDNAELTRLQRLLDSLHQPAVLVMEHSDDGVDVPERGIRFNDLRLIQAEDPDAVVLVDVVALLIDQVDQLLPAIGTEIAQPPHVLLALPLLVERRADHIAGTQAPQVELDAAGDERLVEGTRPSARG